MATLLHERDQVCVGCTCATTRPSSEGTARDGDDSALNRGKKGGACTHPAAATACQCTRPAEPYTRRALECLLVSAHPSQGQRCPDESRRLPPSSAEKGTTTPPITPPAPRRQLVHASRPRTTTSVTRRDPSVYSDVRPGPLSSAATSNRGCPAPRFRFGRVGRVRVVFT